VREIAARPEEHQTARLRDAHASDVATTQPLSTAGGPGFDRAPGD